MGISRAQFLSAGSLPTKTVDVPELGDNATIVVRCLTARGRFEWGSASRKAVQGEPGPDPTSLLVALAAIDDSGERLFQLQDVDSIGEMRGDVVDRIAQAVMDISGLTVDSNETAVADAEGNSGATPSGGSPSDSPETSAAQ